MAAEDRHTFVDVGEAFAHLLRTLNYVGSTSWSVQDPQITNQQRAQQSPLNPGQLWLRVIAACSVPLIVALSLAATGASGFAVLGFALGSAAVCAALLYFTTIRSIVDQLIEATLTRASAEHALADEVAARDFRDRLDLALRSSHGEPSTLRTGLRAVGELLPESDVSLLLNLPGDIRVGWQVRLADGALEQARPVPGTPSCSALGSGETVVSPSRQALDSCAHIQSSTTDVSSVCIPVRLGDRTLGSVCATSAPGEVPGERTLVLVEWAVERTAIRVAEQRLEHGPSNAGRPDPVTGLPGPVALRHQLRDLVRTLSPFCVGIAVIDDFEKLRYDLDEETVDDCLRLAADALCATLRPDDMVCRIDESRFAVVLADCSAIQATSALERVRESLALMLASEPGVGFTCSAGIVESHRGTSLDGLIDMASTACEDSQTAGGNRVTLAYEPHGSE